MRLVSHALASRQRAIRIELDWINQCGDLFVTPHRTLANKQGLRPLGQTKNLYKAARIALPHVKLYVSASSVVSWLYKCGREPHRVPKTVPANVRMKDIIVLTVGDYWYDITLKSFYECVISFSNSAMAKFIAENEEIQPLAWWTGHPTASCWLHVCRPPIPLAQEGEYKAIISDYYRFNLRVIP